ncbi:MAG: hypothetical protein EBV06_12810 [Planctomycetia bacterium]|nr:hypothetical protein [Planctomycetia bacterium]
MTPSSDPGSTGPHSQAMPPTPHTIKMALNNCFGSDGQLASLKDCRPFTELVCVHPTAFELFINNNFSDWVLEYKNKHAQFPRLKILIDELSKNLGNGVSVDTCSRYPLIFNKGIQRWERFTDYELLGHGSFGVVYKAKDSQLNRLVAIKYCWDPNRELDEFKMQANFSHKDHFVTVYEVINEGYPGVVMEYLPNPTLKKHLQDSPRITVGDGCRILVSLLRGVEKIHAKGYAHNDLKPGNLFLRESNTICIADFGGAAQFAKHPQQYTPAYAAPELFEGQPCSIRSDHYSVACIAFELFTGHRCHKGYHTGNYTISQAVREKLPKPLLEMLEKGLDRDSNKRPDNAAEFRRPFEEYVNTLPPIDDENHHHLGDDLGFVRFGRDDFIRSEVNAIIQNLGTPCQGRLYHGSGGIGKTTVAEEIARHKDLVSHFGSERYRVVLDGVESAIGVRNKLADAFGLTGNDRLTDLTRKLKEPRKRLILLDTVDEPLHHDRSNVEDLLNDNYFGKSTSLTLLMTSRIANCALQEWCTTKKVEPMPSLELADIFHNRTKNKFKEDQYLKDVLGYADGMPLAAKLLGAYAQNCDNLLDVVREWTEQGPDILPQNNERRNSLDRTIEMSLKRFDNKPNSPTELRLLRLLADLPGGLLTEVIKTKLTGIGMVAVHFLRNVGGLADEKDGRWTMLAPIREVLRKKLNENADDWNQLIDAACEWLFVQGDKYFCGDVTPLARFRTERDDLEKLLHKGLASEHIASVQGTLGYTYFVQRLGGDYDKLLKLLRRASSLGTAREMPYEAAVCMGQIADVLQDRGQWEEALRIYREEVLPAFERLGDVRSIAVTQGKIADVLQSRGQWEEALRIRREEELPVYERLGALREMVITRIQKAILLAQHGQPHDQAEALADFQYAIDQAKRLQMAELSTILEWYKWFQAQQKNSSKGATKTAP